jgi:hypothetical protein
LGTLTPWHGIGKRALRLLLLFPYSPCVPDRPTAPQDPDGAPLAGTLAAVRAHFGGHDVLSTRVTPQPGWLHAADLLAGGSALDELLARAIAATATDRADIGGTLLVESYAWALTVRSVGTLLFADRIPSLAPDDVWFELAMADTTVTAAALTGGAFGIAGDPGGDDPALVLLDSPAALLAQLHTELQQHLEPLLRLVRAATGRPLTALWRSAGDRLAGAFLWLGEVAGMRERAWRLGTETMAAGQGPLAVGAGFRVLEHAGIAEPTRNRRGCCLIWRAEGGETCFTCPLTTEAERCARLAARAVTT